MLRIKGLLTTLMLVLGLLMALGGQSGLCAETWRLDEQGQWKQAAETNEGQFQGRVAEIKKSVDKGKSGKVEKAYKLLKKDFPQIAGEDFNAWVAGEILLSKGNLSKAITQYDKLMARRHSSTLRFTRESSMASAVTRPQKR